VSVQEELQRQYLEVTARYFGALQDAGVAEDDTSRAAAAYASYVQAVEDATPSPQLRQRAEDAYRAWAETCRQIWSPEARAERAAGAYRSYLGGLRDALAGVDPEAFPPAELATLAHSMLAVAWTASATADREGG
jgi:hypothetical protein